jgi:beta-galactosidase
MKREIININNDWKFTREDQPLPGYGGIDDSEWRDVRIPHDWSVEADFSREYSSGTGYLANGVGWYRKHFSLPDAHRDRKVFLTFEGVYNNSQVWCNSYYINKRPYGYSTFTYDITDFVHFGANDNVISVKVDHKENADSRWFTGSGIYRNVYLTVTDHIHFSEYGVFVTSAEANEEKASLVIETDIEGLPANPEGLEQVFMLKDSSRHICAEITAAVATRKESVLLTVLSPNLWFPNTPTLYTIVAQIRQNGDIIDEVTVTTGIRTFRFDARKGFFINKTNMKMKGVCLHHDAGCLGAAVPKSVWRRRFSELKSMGCNAIRCSHNPPAPEFLDLCDEMGFLVMDEAFDEWEGVKNKWWNGHNVLPPKHFGYYEDFPEWHKRDLQDMVKRDRNHPAIVCWSIGNEIDYPNDPYSHPAQDELRRNNESNAPPERSFNPEGPSAERLPKIAHELVQLVKECDTTRPVTSALAAPQISNITGYADTLDIVGYNYREHLYDADTKRWPDRVILGSENGKGLEEWEYVRDNENICAQFLWTGIDYLGEAAGWPTRIAAAGLMTAASYRKALWYYRQSLWSTVPMIQLATVPVEKQDRYDSERFHWNYMPSEQILVKAYSNCERVELSVNGTVVGTGKPSAERLRFASWTVPFAAGEIEAVVIDDGGNRYISKLVTTGKPVKIIASAYKAVADPYGYDEIDITLADSKSNIVSHTDRIIEVAIAGPAELVGLENGNTTDLTPYYTAQRSTFLGRLKAYVRSENGSSVVRLTCADLEEARVEL